MLWMWLLWYWFGLLAGWCDLLLLDLWFCGLWLELGDLVVVLLVLVWVCRRVGRDLLLLLLVLVWLVGLLWLR